MLPRPPLCLCLSLLLLVASSAASPVHVIREEEDSPPEFDDVVWEKDATTALPPADAAPATPATPDTTSSSFVGIPPAIKKKLLDVLLPADHVDKAVPRPTLKRIVTISKKPDLSANIVSEDPTLVVVVPEK